MSDSWDQKIYQDRQLDGQIEIICAPKVLQCFLYHLPTQVLAAISQYLACFYQPFKYLFKGMLCFETCSKTENPDKKGMVWKLLTQFFRQDWQTAARAPDPAAALCSYGTGTMFLWVFCVCVFFTFLEGCESCDRQYGLLGLKFYNICRSKGNGYLHKLEF